MTDQEKPRDDRAGWTKADWARRYYELLSVWTHNGAEIKAYGSYTIGVVGEEAIHVGRLARGTTAQPILERWIKEGTPVSLIDLDGERCLCVPEGSLYRVISVDGLIEEALADAS